MVARPGQRRGKTLRPGLDDRFGRRRQAADHDRHTGLDDAGLLDSDRLDRRTELCLVVEVDGGNCRIGRTTLVASSRPPSPTSRTAISTPAPRNSSNAAAVVHSKKVGGAVSTPRR